MGLKKLGKMKGISTIFMENVPQLIIQIIYSFNIGEVSNNTQLAFVGSMISVISALLSYFIEQSNTDNMIVFKYYLKMTKNDIVNNAVMDPNANDNDEDEMKIESVSPRAHSPKEFSNSGTLPNFLTKDETDHLKNHRGETAALSSKLCSIFCIPEKNIEVSKASNITSDGIMLYLIHFINRDDNGLDMYNVDINEIKKLYKKNAKKINDSFKKQFAFQTNDFKVGWKRYADDNDEDYEDEHEFMESAIKNAMIMKELDFNSLPARKRFLSQFMLAGSDKEAVDLVYDEGINDVALPQNAVTPEHVTSDIEMENIEQTHKSKEIKLSDVNVGMKAVDDDDSSLSSDDADIKL